MSTIVTNASDIASKLNASMEAVLVEEESRLAALGMRTVRVMNDLTKWTLGTPYFVYECNGEAATMDAASAIERNHPMAHVADGETVSYPSEFGRVTMKRVGIFEVLTQVSLPVGERMRMKLMAARAA